MKFHNVEISVSILLSSWNAGKQTRLLLFVDIFLLGRGTLGYPRNIGHPITHVKPTNLGVVSSFPLLPSMMLCLSSSDVYLFVAFL